MSGTNFPTGLVNRKKFDGDVTDSRLAADTKFVNKTAIPPTTINPITIETVTILSNN